MNQKRGGNREVKGRERESILKDRKLKNYKKEKRNGGGVRFIELNIISLPLFIFFFFAFLNRN